MIFNLAILVTGADQVTVTVGCRSLVGAPAAPDAGALARRCRPIRQVTGNRPGRRRPAGGRVPATRDSVTRDRVGHMNTVYENEK